MIPNNITKPQILKAITEIDKKGVPVRRESRKFLLEYQGKLYPPKYVIALANRYANGNMLSSEIFSGGEETNEYLRNLGFKIVSKVWNEVLKTTLQEIPSIKIENKPISLTNWLATIVIESDNNYNNSIRLRAMETILESIHEKIDESGVILFPGGWFKAGSKTPKTLYPMIQKEVTKLIKQTNGSNIICLGIDGRGWKDQMALAINKDGIIALGRKFYPTKPEKEYLQKADSWQSDEEGITRIFEKNNKKYFLCACYDGFGIKGLKLPNKYDINVVLDCIHNFNPKGEGGSGDVYFAKYGLAGSSKQWNCLSFGAVVYFRRSIPENWPSGVYWNQGKKEIRYWRYQDNPFQPVLKYRINIPEGEASIRIFDLK